MHETKTPKVPTKWHWQKSCYRTKNHLSSLLRYGVWCVSVELFFMDPYNGNK